MRSFTYWPNKAVATLLTIGVVLTVVVLGFYLSPAAEAHHKPGHGQGSGGTTPTACSKGQFLAEYRNELRTFNTQPVLSRCEAATNYDWGSGSPGSGVNADSFTARWVGTFDFEASDYEFAVTADDGVRLFVDGQLLIEQWQDQPATTYKATKTMTAGAHEVKVEYYEYGGAAVAKASWAKAAATPPPLPDTTPPETTISAGPAEGSTTTQPNASFGFTSSEADAAFSCQLDGGGFSPCTSPKTYNSLSNGSHTFEVKATDAAGNTDATPARRTWTVNATTQSDDPVFVGAGDIASCASSGDEATANLLDGIPGTVYNLGDNAYEAGTDAEFANCYDPSWGRHKARTKPTPGNHEYNTAGASGYYNYFGAAAGARDKGYYSYDLGAWHIISLNSMCENVGGCGTSSPMVTWLKADLTAHPSSCTLAYWHHPVFSSGSEHGNDPKMIPSWDALYAAGADVVLSGHDHDYERFAPQTSSGVADSARGIREFVVGTGGKSHYAFGTIRANSVVRNSDTNGVLKLTLHPTSYDWRFVPEAGKAFSDSGSASCH